jgi:Ni/Co efflux regulator RcnB
MPQNPSGQGQRFGSTAANPQQRTFGSTAPGAPGQPARRFGGGPPSESPRAFGSSSTGRTFGGGPQGGSQQHFGGEAALGAERHFGGSAGTGTHNFAERSGPRRSTSGREFSYQGRKYQRFAAERYHYPPGYAYHRYVVGYRLPRNYIVRDYYIDNYTDYGLAAPPDDYQWVRYGPDILLVDTDTGEIAQVVYGAFDEQDGPQPGGYADAPDQSQDNPN